MKKAPPVIGRGVQQSVIRSDPWVDQIDAAELKVRNVASYQRKPVHKRGGGDQGFAFTARSGTCNRAHRVATLVSTGRILPENAGLT